MTRWGYRKNICSQEGPYNHQYSNPDVVQLPLNSAATLLFACSHLDIDLASKESILIDTT